MTKNAIKTVDILGTRYLIVVKDYDNEVAFERRSICGYCDAYTKEIVVCDMHTYKGWEHEAEKTILQVQKQPLRHEIVHAFFEESGLSDSSNVFEGAWAKNEELVGWIANQGKKIYAAWLEADAI